MEQTAFVSLKNEWEDLDELLESSLESGETYSFECHGPNACLVAVASAKPTDMGGVLLDANGMKTLSYAVGSDNVYVCATGNSSSLNIVKTS